MFTLIKKIFKWIFDNDYPLEEEKIDIFDRRRGTVAGKRFKEGEENFKNILWLIKEVGYYWISGDPNSNVVLTFDQYSYVINNINKKLIKGYAYFIISPESIKSNVIGDVMFPKYLLEHFFTEKEIKKIKTGKFKWEKLKLENEYSYLMSHNSIKPTTRDNFLRIIIEKWVPIFTPIVNRYDNNDTLNNILLNLIDSKYDVPIPEGLLEKSNNEVSKAINKTYLNNFIHAGLIYLPKKDIFNLGEVSIKNIRFLAKSQRSYVRKIQNYEIYKFITNNPKDYKVKDYFFSESFLCLCRFTHFRNWLKNIPSHPKYTNKEIYQYLNRLESVEKKFKSIAQQHILKTLQDDSKRISENRLMNNLKRDPEFFIFHLPDYFLKVKGEEDNALDLISTLYEFSSLVNIKKLSKKRKEDLVNNLKSFLYWAKVNYQSKNNIPDYIRQELISASSDVKNLLTSPEDDNVLAKMKGEVILTSEISDYYIRSNSYLTKDTKINIFLGDSELSLKLESDPPLVWVMDGEADMKKNDDFLIPVPDKRIYFFTSVPYSECTSLYSEESSEIDLVFNSTLPKEKSFYRTNYLYLVAIFNPETRSLLTRFNNIRTAIVPRMSDLVGFVKDRKLDNYFDPIFNDYDPRRIKKEKR